MSITKYQIFLKTAACGSFSKAAEAMNFTQSGISHAINSLEGELGVTLLSRNRGGVVLTADGRALLPQIEKLCAAHHTMMQTVESLKGMDSGLVKVATFSSVSFLWLPRILKSFGQIYPNIEFEVITGDYYEQIESWIVSGAVDCGFFRLPSTKHLQTYPCTGTSCRWWCPATMSMPKRTRFRHRSWPRSHSSCWRRGRTTRSWLPLTSWASGPM